MIPISDERTPRRHFPVLTYGLIALNALVFLYELTLSEPRLEAFFYAYGVVPIAVTTGTDVPPGAPAIVWLTLFTSQFLHGGWAHFLGNMLYLWVFGDNVEDTLGRKLYLPFYLGCGVVAGLAQIAVAPLSHVPSIGASGAIAGVLGAYLLLFPHALVRTVIAFGYFIRIVPVPAIVVIGFWIVIQFFSGLASLGVATMETGGVAYWAHVGGFVAGVALIMALRGGDVIRRWRQRRQPEPAEEEEGGFF